ncbi:hypothetical protein [Clostridium sp. HBUAS56010]|uniref:hypothetical protein n=1 Tax=Clostridium sp. HBUAS56010 TaxID=2571127 RepID=UPI001177A6F8|nr:hypothetical protein [Clostridium sp. HBUAS56010]
MEKGLITIDGVDLRLWVTGIKRNFAVTDSEHSGRVKSNEMYRDVIGTFYNYTLTAEPDSNHRGDYDTFYEVITSPVPFHTLVFPYGQTTLEFLAYVTSGEDEVKIDTNGDKQVNRWSGLSVQFIAKAPQRRP